MAEPDIRKLKVGPRPHLGPSNISKGRARALLGPCHATPLKKTQFVIDALFEINGYIEHAQFIFF